MIPFALVGAYDTYQAQFVPGEHQKFPVVIEFLPAWPWWTRVIIGLCVTLLLVMESSYRIIRDAKRDDANAPCLEISVADLRWSLEPPKIVYKITLTFKANIPIQVADVVWLWDVSEGELATTTQINHADSLPFNYIEGIESHEITFTVPLYSGHYETLFRVLAHGRYWYSDNFGVGQAPLPV